MNISGINIENIIKFEIKPNFKAEAKNKFPILGYEINYYKFFPKNPGLLYKNNDYVADDIVKLLQNASKNGIYCYTVKITNIGNTILNKNDVYEEAKLRITQSGFLVGCIDNELTDDYIGAKMVKHEGFTYYIDFNEIKPGDSIHTVFYSDLQLGTYNIIPSCETKYMKKLIDIKSYIEFQKSKRQKKIIGISAFLIILIIFLFMSFIVKHPNLKLQIKVLEGVEILNSEKLPKVN